MEPLLIILVPGVLGGVALALFIAGVRWAPPSTVVPKRLAAPASLMINMARIPVEGVGGLGLVAAVVTVAITDPRIRSAILLAALFGAGLALVLIAVRRHDGGMPSSGNGPDDRSLLHLDDGQRRPQIAAAGKPADHAARTVPTGLRAARPAARPSTWPVPHTS